MAYRFPLSRLSFRWQVLLLGGMVVVLIGAVLFATFGAFRYTKSSVLADERRTLLGNAQDLARAYADRADFAHQNGAAPLDSPADGVSSAELAMLTRMVLGKAEGVEGGFYQSSSGAIVGYAAPAIPDDNAPAGSALESQRAAITRVARDAAASREPSGSVVATPDAVILIESAPISAASGAVGSAWTVKRLGSIPGANRFRTYLAAVALGAAALICVLLTLLVARNLQFGVVKVERGLESLERNLASRIDVDGDPREIERISGAINRLGATLREKIASEKQIEDQLRHAERLAALGRLVAGVAHEVRNPLATIRLRVQLCQQASSDPAILDSCEIALEEIERLNGMVNRLLNFSQPVQLSSEPLDVCQLLEQRLDRMADRARRQNVRFITNFPGQRRMVLLDANRMSQVFDNLIVNAIEAMAQSGGTLCVGIWSNATKVAAGQELCIEFNDTGSGIDPAIATRVFDPFFTTKPAGTGLGLSICHELVRAHGGDIQVRSAVGHGTSVRLLLPVAEFHAMTGAA